MRRLMLLLPLVGCDPEPVPEPPEETGVEETGEVEEPPVDISSDVATIKGDRVLGMVAALADAERVRAVGAAGERQRGGDAQVTPDDVFHFGSITKVYTALLVARLVDAGELSWDLTLGEVFSDTHPDWSDVSLKMLLRHEGGATGSIGRDFSTLWSDLYAEGDSDLLASRARFASILLAEPPSQSPGTVVYSNAGFMLVGAAIEARRGVTWEEDVTAWVLEPLGQTGCIFGPPQGDQPWGHDSRTGAPKDPSDATSDNPPALGPAGTLACPVSQLAGLGQVYLRASAGDTSFVSAESYETLTTANAVGYVPGMIRSDSQPWAGGPAFAMTGSNTFWLSMLWIAPGVERTYAVISNEATSAAEAANNDAILFLIDAPL